MIGPFFPLSSLPPASLFLSIRILFFSEIYLLIISEIFKIAYQLIFFKSKGFWAFGLSMACRRRRWALLLRHQSSFGRQPTPLRSEIWYWFNNFSLKIGKLKLRYLILKSGIKRYLLKNICQTSFESSPHHKHAFSAAIKDLELK